MEPARLALHELAKICVARRKKLSDIRLPGGACRRPATESLPFSRQYWKTAPPKQFGSRICFVGAAQDVRVDIEIAL